jgi:DNA mismatch repair protein MutS
METLLNKLDASDPERMTPIEALLLLSELKKLAKYSLA